MRWLVDGQAFYEQRLDVMWTTSSGAVPGAVTGRCCGACLLVALLSRPPARARRSSGHDASGASAASQFPRTL